MVARMTLDLRGFLRRPISEQEALAIVKRRLETRSERFLAMAEQTIYNNPRSPYLQLLRAVGCELGDLKATLTKDGLDATLYRLADAGVYVTLDEFKGRKEAVRGNQRFVCGRRF
jgi:hypothetical protein